MNENFNPAEFLGQLEMIIVNNLTPWLVYVWQSMLAIFIYFHRQVKGVKIWKRKLFLLNHSPSNSEKYAVPQLTFADWWTALLMSPCSGKLAWPGMEEWLVGDSQTLQFYAKIISLQCHKDPKLGYPLELFPPLQPPHWQLPGGLRIWTLSLSWSQRLLYGDPPCVRAFHHTFYGPHCNLTKRLCLPQFTEQKTEARLPGVHVSGKWRGWDLNTGLTSRPPCFSLLQTARKEREQLPSFEFQKIQHRENPRGWGPLPRVLP